MSVILTLLMMGSLILLVVGLIKPSILSKVIKNPSRKKIGLILGIATFILFIAVGITAPPQKTETATSKPQPTIQAQPEKKLYQVSNVVDGDTIDVQIEGKKETIRLIGIDTPETVDPREPVQCFGKEASDKAKELLSNKKVSLVADSSQGERDKYNRLLRYVYLEDGTNFNKKMIEDGFAHEYTYNLPYKYQNDFKDAEKKAREGNKGLWSPSSCSGDTTKPATTTTTTQPAPAPATTSPAPAPVSSPTPSSSGGVVKKSSTGICHAPGTTYYDKTTNYTPYNSIDACLASGGRLPKR